MKHKKEFFKALNLETDENGLEVISDENSSMDSDMDEDDAEF